jgi:dienelactone hydrolase
VEELFMCIHLQFNIFIILILFICTSCECNNSFADVVEIENLSIQPYYSPTQKGPYTFVKIHEKTTLPSYMKNVDDLTYRIPVQSNNIKPPYPLVIIEPGFFARSTSLDNIQDYYASHGFLVAGVNNTSHFNLITKSPEPYRQALFETIQFVLESNQNKNSPLFGSIDTNAIGISGHSMGGGGTLLACDSTNIPVNKYIRAAIAMNPFGKIPAKKTTIPILLFASNNDSLFNPFMPGVSSSPEDIFFSFRSIPQTTTKLFANFDEMDHNAVCDYNIFLPTSGNTNTFMPLMIAWFKIYLLKDLRYATWIVKSGKGFDSLKTRYRSKGIIPAYIFNQQ